MSRTVLSYLVLPRLHPELLPPLPLPEGALLLWPGLPQPPASGVFIPPWPWSPAQAAACVDDFERAGRDGAAGAPVLSLWAADPGLADERGPSMSRTSDISAGERQALRRFMEQAAPGTATAGRPDSPSGTCPDCSPASSGDHPADDSADSADAETRRQLMRQAAQRTLLLAWLQERQALELRDLSLRVRRERAALAGLLSEGKPALVTPEPRESAHQAPDPLPLPPWRAVLAAAALFLPAPAPAAPEAFSASLPARSSSGECRDMAVLALDRDMSESLAALADRVPGAGSCALPAPPPGFHGARLPLSRVLGRAWAAGRIPETEREILFLWPAAWPPDQPGTPAADSADRPADRPADRADEHA